MAEAEQTPSTSHLDFPLPLLEAVRRVTSQGFALAETWEAFEQALIWDRIYAWDPRRAHFEELASYLQEFSQAGTPPADTDVIRRRGHIRGSTWRQWLADGSLDRETGTIDRLFEGRRSHKEVFEPVLEGADVHFVYSILSARRETHATQPPAAPVPATENATVEPFRTGAPGRPSAKHLIMSELQRRITEGELIPRWGGLRGASTKLVAWWEVERQKHLPAGPRVTAASIENIIRPEWNRAIAKD
jgi:hypothetical protein